VVARVLPEVRLRPFAAGDEARVLGWIDGEEQMVLWSGKRFRHPLDLAQLRDYRLDAARPGSARRAYAVELDGDVVGHVELAGLDHVRGTGVLARVLVAPAARGRGIGEAMLRAVLRTAFAELRVELLLLRVYAHNDAALGLYRRLGFRRLQLAPELVDVAGQRWEVLTMQLAVESWRAAGDQPQESCGTV
jgi:RimJ/RimL family protein N-acetyltransferase